MNNQNQINTYKEFVKPYYIEKDSAHNFQHIERMINVLNVLSEGISEPINHLKLYFLACFHGLGKLFINDNGFNKKVHDFLGSHGWTTKEIIEVVQSLNRHLIDPQSIEEKIVHDANYVELLGALGIAKAFTTGGAQGQSMEETANIFEYQYLDKVKFHTKVGEQLLKEKINYTKDFLSRLRNEL